MKQSSRLKETPAIKRRATRAVFKGAVQVGGGAPISVQSMTTTETRQVDATIRQIRSLERIGCDIVRVAAPSREDARAIAKIKSAVRIPVVADVHFNWRLAIEAIEAGADCVRVNPGNLGAARNARAVFDAARAAGISVRIGVNSGSIRERKGAHVVGPRGTAQLMVEKITDYLRLAERCGLDQVLVSAKCADALETIEVNRAIARATDCPIHLGVTAAGTFETALVRNSVGLGVLLAEGIGDTIRVSITGKPGDEVLAGHEILDSLHLGRPRPRLVACPTCGRCRIDLVRIARKVRRRLATVKAPIEVAVMGCVVNGPGEASEADVGIAGGKGYGLLFRKGRQAVKVPEKQLLERLFEAIEEIAAEADSQSGGTR